MTDRIDDGIIVMYVSDGMIYPLRIHESRIKNIKNAFPNLLGGLNNIFVDTGNPQGEAVNISEDIDYIEICIK
jgi:hypothetical protein